MRKPSEWFMLTERDLMLVLAAAFGGGFLLGIIAAAEFIRWIGK